MPNNQNTQKFTQNHQTEVKVKAMLHWSIIFEFKLWSVPENIFPALQSWQKKAIQPRSQDPLSTTKKYPGYGWSRVCLI